MSTSETIRPARTTPGDVTHQLDADGGYRIEHYDQLPAFSSFLPGVGGLAGVPLWCMYVNRAQAVVSFGIHSKDHAIAEFLPATWAYQLVGTQGFRTFCKIDGTFYEPFASDTGAGVMPRRTMRIHADRLELFEDDGPHGLRFEVEYFSPVNQPLGTLARRLRVINRSPRPCRLQLLDGLPLILPAGFTDFSVKKMRHISEAYALVRLVDGAVPFYAGKVAMHDEPEVRRITHGHFYAAWRSQPQGWAPIEPLVDPHVVFGAGRDLVHPREFTAHDSIRREDQVWENRLPCALAPAETLLEPDADLELVALAGYAPDEHALTNFLARFRNSQDLDAAQQASAALVTSIVAPAATFSSQPLFDHYVRQCCLDNVLRGGVPQAFPSREGPVLLHPYARRHGDLERDYNNFILPPHPLSSGAGNYRDVCQNRRCDLWFYPSVDDHEIRMFVDFLHADGYNPLNVAGYQWELADGEPDALCPATDPAARAAFRKCITRAFQPGQLLEWAQRYHPHADTAWLDEVLAHCRIRAVGDGHDGGYWIDHWTYIVDLLESYAAVFPDQVVPMLFEPDRVGWFGESAFVAPRSTKYVRRGTRWMQLDAVYDAPAPLPPLARTSIYGKLCALLALKSVTFDYSGRGIEMEAGRPGWNDSLNGLPALFGSSTCEAAEVARLARWLRPHAPDAPDTALPEEIAELIDAAVADLESPDYDWDRAATVRETYRARIYARSARRTRTVAGPQLQQLLVGVERRALHAVEQSRDPASGLLHTYYVNAPRGADAAAPPTQFDAQPLPLYLEGQVHWLRLLEDAAQARAVHQAVRKSPLYDDALAMYKVCECLDACSPEIGRARTFTRGWFENESIWLHMSYKYLLELLKAGLFEEFHADARTMLVPFMDPQRYGRSVLENSSFLGSSANPDPRTHGRGFIARLSGATAEFLHMWLLLTVGPRPITLRDNELCFRLQPALPGDWFTQAPTTNQWNGQALELPDNCFACALLGHTLLVYHNPTRANTFGPSAVKPVRYLLDDTDAVAAVELTGDTARRVRDRAYRRLDVWLE